MVKGGVEEKKVGMRKIPVIDMSKCTDCESCLEICPSVFKRNKETGYIDVIELDEYPEEDVQEAISTCPADCIKWEKCILQDWAAGPSNIGSLNC